ncbi:class I SAM-dependent methyltransferase [Aidingimonas lacisalsi]|uniref:class I SAM-dependent methyltransferase n=1 Tax=Aidingimonas lacisalsi TaxID=2604086 RepID=UPI00191C4D56|nr:phospholipid methyltransferase [Aidingimonas lacisalsi]
MNHGSLSDAFGFLRAYITNPLLVGAVIPSGRALSNLITSEISVETGPVIELGPGTGTFTRALIARGIPQEDLALIECGSEFASKLQHRFERTHIHCMDASRLEAVELFEGRPAGAIISGLPLLSMTPGKVMAILDSAFAKMRPDGIFYQFTYGPTCPIPRALLDRLGLKAILIGRRLANVPPAAVYRICRRQPHPGVGTRTQLISHSI